MISGILSGIIGIGLLLSRLYGIQSLQDSIITSRMLYYSLHFPIAIFLSLCIYCILMFLDIIFYPPLLGISPVKHRSLLDQESYKYGNHYMVEAIILFLIIFSCFPSHFPYSSNCFLDVIFSIPHALIHLDLLQLIFNSLSIYFIGKIIAAKIGPFHFLAFFLVAMLFSTIFTKVMLLHLKGVNLFYPMGASGAVGAVITKYFSDYQNNYRVLSIQLTGYEYLIYCILIFFVLLLNLFNYSVYLTGLLFGILFWDFSIWIWKYREIMSKKYYI